ncbi:MAG: hypothetical protein H7839_15355 [Magnetococcus sp. YQC-5]
MIGKRFYLLVFVAIFWILSAPAAANEQVKGRLLVFITDYCPYCKGFMDTIMPVYPKTQTGKHFPITVIDNFSPPKEWESLAWEIRFYPTFLVLDQRGKKIGQFRGYRGEEFFWSEFEAIIARIPSGP